MLFILLVAMTVGALWAGIAGLLKTTRGISEVISTIMLNAIATSGIVAWLSVAWREGGLSTNSGTKTIADSGHIFNLTRLVELFTRDVGGGRELSGVFLIAIVVGIWYHLLVNRSRFGFDLRASGYNPIAARVGGVPPKRRLLGRRLISCMGSNPSSAVAQSLHIPGEFLLQHVSIAERRLELRPSLFGRVPL